MPEAVALADAIVARHGRVRAVLFYGSCLRRGTAEGVLDFYVVLDGYRAAGQGAFAALMNACLPPNVVYLECKAPPGTEAASAGDAIRCKYALVSIAQFERLTQAGALHPYFWARFAQPTALAWVRDAETRGRIEEAVAEALVTFCRRLAPFMPSRSGVQRFSLAAFWQQALRRTYSSELRPEATETIRGLYRADAERFDDAARLAFRELAARGLVRDLEEHGPAVELRLGAVRRVLGRLRWRLLWPIAKGLAVLRLLKTAFTFGDWLPYALWKLERHTGERIELSEPQASLPAGLRLAGDPPARAGPPPSLSAAGPAALPSRAAPEGRIRPAHAPRAFGSSAGSRPPRCDGTDPRSAARPRSAGAGCPARGTAPTA